MADHAALDRAVPGHWEGDLFFGSHNSQIATLVERQTRYLMPVKAPGKDTETAVDALIKQAHKLPRELYEWMTWDRGKKTADHRRLSLATDIQVYFCDPQQPWQRGSNENTYGLLRQYFPKGMDVLRRPVESAARSGPSLAHQRDAALITADLKSACGHRYVETLPCQNSLQTAARQRGYISLQRARGRARTTSRGAT